MDQLAVRSHFSIGESTLTIGDLIDEAKAAGATSVALTDTMSITGMIEFTNKAKKAEIKPIIGCRLRIVDDPSWRKTKEDKKAPPEYFITWYVLSEKGLSELFRLLTRAHADDRFYNVPKLGFDDVFEALSRVSSEDVALASSDFYSVIRHREAHTLLLKLADALRASETFPAHVFLTLVPVDTPYWDSFNATAMMLAENHDLPLIVARPALYKRDGADANEVLTAVANNRRLADPWHNSPAARDLYVMNAEEIARQAVNMAKRLDKRGVADAGKRVLNALKRTDEISDLVKYEWSKAPVSLPEMASDEFGSVVAACKAGWATRFASPVFAHKPSQKELDEVYRPRLAYELRVLRDLGFSGYFLLVQDIVRFAKESGILVGPGRGSVGGSLVAYLMGITDCDPIRFGLIFERFINPDRIDLPDADLDFMSERRGEIIEYLIDKYGKDRVAGISNFGKFGPSSAIRGVSKAFGLIEHDFAMASKLVPKEHGNSLELAKSAEAVAEIGQFRDKYPPVWNICLQLEGVMNTLGRHAAGVVVSGCDIVERAVIERRADGATVNWDKRIVEDQGLVKVDILGLQTLDLIKLTLDYIAERHAKRINLLRIPLDDEKVLAHFAAGETLGIFQFESGGMRRLLKELGRDGTITFDDITAATALYRPGPMDSGMMDSYYRRKQGEENVDFDHPRMADALTPTFGVMVYQEQVMQVARDIAGYSMADADKLRKIMGKKLPEEMAKERGRFVEGCVATTAMSKELAGEIFDKIEKFAGYGFNKSHSVEYTLISYQSMWLKTNYPVEFYAAALSLMDEKKLAAILKDAKEAGIEVVTPDINLSTDRFEILTDTRLCIPFGRVKGISVNTAAAIGAVRKDGEIKSIEDLKKRVERRKCNVRHIETLNKIGAFARVEPDQKPANHPDRIKDQRELIPGLISESVPIARSMVIDRHVKTKLAEIAAEYRDKHGAATGDGDGMPVRMTLGSKARFVVIADCPTRHEEELGKMAYGDSFAAVTDALDQAGLSRADGYWTALIKRPKEGRQVAPVEIATYLPYLQRELEVLNPPIIVLLGSTVVRQFIPSFKGKASDEAGSIVYNDDMNANLVVGFNPGEIYYAPEKQAAMNDVFHAVASLLA